MNWDYWLPWRSNETEDSEQDSRVIEGDGPKRVLVNESEYENPEEITG